jgi:hypothetical protein
MGERIETTMQYLLLLYVNEKGFEAIPDAEKGPRLAEYTKFHKELAESGALVGSNRLQSVTTATSVRVTDGKLKMTDGPFMETREQLGGYFLIEAKNLDEATQIAARCPTARHGVVEIRPIWPM